MLIGRDRELSQIEQLLKAVRARGSGLLVLDNLEQLGKVPDDLLAALGRGAAETRIVITSRVRPRLRGARILELSPLEPTDASALFLELATDGAGSRWMWLTG